MWDKAAESSSLILDLRFSTAGGLSGVPFLISYLSDPQPHVHFGTVYNRPTNTTTELWTRSPARAKKYGGKKDVIVLISRRTAGAAEAVAYTLKHLRRAIIVGERSAGSSVQLQKFRIAGSDFYVMIPVARFVSPITGKSWEVSGVPPMVNVAAREFLAKAQSFLAARSRIPKVLQVLSDIGRFYAFTDMVPALPQHLKSVDMFSVVSEEDLAVRLNHKLQTASEDPRLIVRHNTGHHSCCRGGPWAWWQTVR